MSQQCKKETVEAAQSNPTAGRWEGLHNTILGGTPTFKDLSCPFSISRVVHGLIYLAMSGVKKNAANKNSFLGTKNS